MENRPADAFSSHKNNAMKMFRNSMYTAQNALVKTGSFLAGLSMLFLFSACGEGGGGSAGGSTVITGNLQACHADSIRLFQIQGGNAITLTSAALTSKDGNSTFEMSVKLPAEGMYMLGDAPQRAQTFLFGSEGGTHELTGNCQNVQGSYRLSNAPVNDQYQSMMQRLQAHNQRMQMLMQNMQVFRMSDPSQVQRLQGEMQTANTSHYAWLDSMAADPGIIGKIAKLYNYKPFMSDPSHSSYGNEMEYFRQTFMSAVDFNDPVISALPQVFEKARAYSASLAQRGTPPEVLKSTFDELLGKAGAGSPGHQNLLKGIVGGLEQVKHDLYITYGETYVTGYPQDVQFVGAVNANINKMKATRVGAAAPEISENDPSGNPVSLSDFRGNYVLVDFWASWCRPCRMENPNVVKAYKKYHPKGFEIMAVSLDQKKDKWVAAIEQDGLVWKHCSDLKGWSSRPAATYGVSSIPATVLVDEQGNIAARNLRGPALEKKLEEIYGF